MNKKLFSYFSAGILALSCYLPPLYLFTDTFMLPKFYLLLLSVGCMGIWVALAKGRGWGLPPLNDSLRKGGVSPDGHWVGLKLPAPQRIGKFRFIPRNDGNCGCLARRWRRAMCSLSKVSPAEGSTFYVTRPRVLRRESSRMRKVNRCGGEDLVYLSA